MIELPFLGVILWLALLNTVTVSSILVCLELVTFPSKLMATEAENTGKRQGLDVDWNGLISFPDLSTGSPVSEPGPPGASNPISE